MYHVKDAKRFRTKAGVMLVLVRDNHVLLSRRFNTGIDDGWYVLPMGGLEEGETLRQAIVREAKEEIGVKLNEEDLTLLHTMYRLHHLPDGNTFPQIDFYFTCSHFEGSILNCEPDKCDDLKFFPLHSLPINVVPCIKHALERIQEGIVFSEFGWTEEEKQLTKITHHKYVGKETLSPQVYEKSYADYDKYRGADPDIRDRILRQIEPLEGKSVLDVGCGSGNYTLAFHQKGLEVEGMDLSPSMLRLAAEKAPQIKWKEGSMLQLPFQNEQFDALLSMNTLHYVRHSLVQVFSEMRRVLKPGGRLVLFANTVEQCAQFWACQYFPFVLELGRKVLPVKEEMLTSLRKAGFTKVNFEPYFVTEHTRDLFFYACKYRPQLYLNPEVRAGMTPLQLPEYTAEIEEGCAHLSKDIASGAVFDLIAKQESSLGELFVITAE